MTQPNRTDYRRRRELTARTGLPITAGRDSRVGDEAASDLGRTLQREERRRKRMMRSLTLGASLVAAGALIIGVVTVRALSRPTVQSAALAAATPATSLQPQPDALAHASSPSRPPTSPPAEQPAPAANPAVTVKKTPTPKGDPTVAAARVKAAPVVVPATTVQRFQIAIGRVGYEPSAISAKAHQPITLTVGKGQGCAAGFNMPQLGVHADNSSGAVTVKLGKLKAGTYTYTCSMGMVTGTLRVR